MKIGVLLACWAGGTSLLQAAQTVSPSQPLSWLSEAISRRGLAVGIPLALIGGLALNLTPCVYPMIPVTLAFFSSQAGGKLGRAASLAFAYVLGISLNYAVLGLVAARTGMLFGSWLQQPAVLILVAAVIVVLALSMFGWYELRLPETLSRRLGQAPTGLWGAFLMGALVGLIAAPCIGPVILGLLLLVGQLANPALGFVLFFALGLGMGLPYVVLGVAAHQIGQLPKAGAWLVRAKWLLGVVLLGVALYLLNPILPGLLTWPKPQPASSLRWVPYTEAALAQAKDEHRPALVDIYADWCLPCVEMDQVTFRHPDVIRALESVVTLRVDATREVSPEAQALLERYQVYGVPTLLLFDRAGTERKELRLAGFLAPKEFLERLKQIF